MTYKSIIPFRCEECERTVAETSASFCRRCERLLCRRHFPLGTRLKMSAERTCKICAKAE